MRKMQAQAPLESVRLGTNYDLAPPNPQNLAPAPPARPARSANYDLPSLHTENAGTAAIAGRAPGTNYDLAPPNPQKLGGKN